MQKTMSPQLVTTFIEEINASLKELQLLTKKYNKFNSFCYNIKNIKNVKVISHELETLRQPETFDLAFRYKGISRGYNISITFKMAEFMAATSVELYIENLNIALPFIFNPLDDSISYFSPFKRVNRNISTLKTLSGIKNVFKDIPDLHIFLNCLYNNSQAIKN